MPPHKPRHQQPNRPLALKEKNTLQRNAAGNVIYDIMDLNGSLNHNCYGHAQRDVSSRFSFYQDTPAQTYPVILEKKDFTFRRGVTVATLMKWGTMKDLLADVATAIENKRSNQKAKPDPKLVPVEIIEDYPDLDSLDDVMSTRRFVA